MRARLVIPFVGAIGLVRAAPAVAAPGRAPAGGLSALRDVLLAGAPVDGRVRRAHGFERIRSVFSDPIGGGDGDQAPDATTAASTDTVDSSEAPGRGDRPGASTASTSRGSSKRCL